MAIEIPSTKEIEPHLKKAYDWLQQWHCDVRASSRLDSKTVTDIANLTSYGGRADLLFSRDLFFYVDVHPLIESKDGSKVNLLQFNQQTTNPDHPVTALFYYTDNWETLKAIKCDWLIQDSTPVLDELVILEGGKIVELRKTTKPGELFPTPVILNSEMARRMSQKLQLNFDYSQGGNLQSWSGTVGFCNQDVNVEYSNGLGTGGNFSYQYVNTWYTIPETLNPIPHIQFLARHQEVKPLIG